MKLCLTWIRLTLLLPGLIGISPSLWSIRCWWSTAEVKRSGNDNILHTLISNHMKGIMAVTSCYLLLWWARRAGIIGPRIIGSHWRSRTWGTRGPMRGRWAMGSMGTMRSRWPRRTSRSLNTQT